MQARFIGDPRHGGSGPAELTLWDHSFPKGQWVGVNSPGLFAKLRGNDHFETREGGKGAPPPEVMSEPERPVAAAEVAAGDSKVPANWRELHWKKRVALARELEPELAETINTAAEADQVIEWSEGNGLD